jgi:5-formyltetrahydrofolate cyclo-ligase
LNSHQQKENLRQRLLKQRESISQAEFDSNSVEIVQTLKKQPEFLQAGSIHCYISMNERREVNTHQLIKELLADGKQVVAPVTNFQENTLSHVRLKSYEHLEANKWGVLEPGVGDLISPEQLDLVIVPMVAADEQCNRIGYGEGFYDRFLSKVDCPKIGLIFEDNVVKRLPTEEFDIPLDKIVTEQRLIRCQ